MTHDRNLDYLNKRRIIYRRSPVNDEPTDVFDWGNYYEDGTYECYELFVLQSETLPKYLG